jgi:hypothetical protein
MVLQISSVELAQVQIFDQHFHQDVVLVMQNIMIMESPFVQAATTHVLHVQLLEKQIVSLAILPLKEFQKMH